jgi:hypothetical protein
MGMPRHAVFIQHVRTVCAHVHPWGSAPMAALEIAGLKVRAANGVQVKRAGQILPGRFDATVIDR